MLVRRQFFNRATNQSGFDFIEIPDVVTPEVAAANQAAAHAAAQAENTRRNNQKAAAAGIAAGNGPIAEIAAMMLELLEERQPAAVLPRPDKSK